MIITDRGRPSPVLLAFEDDQGPTGVQANLLELLGRPARVEDVEFESPRSRELGTPAELG